MEIKKSDLKIGINNNVQPIKTKSVNEVIKDDKLYADIDEYDFYFKEERRQHQYIEPGYDYKYYQKELDSVIKNSNGTRDRVANIARFMSREFPKLPYFWGGGHVGNRDSKKGLDPNWGKDRSLKSSGSSSHSPGEILPYSMDCSSFVTWCLINAGYDLDDYVDSNNEYCLNSETCQNLGDKHSITEDNIENVVKPGDIAWKDGHVGIVTEVNKANGTITVAHLSGSGQGMNETTISMKTGKIVDEYYGELPDGYDPVNDPVDGDSNRGVGGSLFTHIISVDYDS